MAGVGPGQNEYELRITIRCLVDDLGLSPDSVRRDVRELVEAHPMIRAFVERRSQSPKGQEVVTDLTSDIVAWTLHSGENRGVTWHDEHNGVVWLMASGFHRSGQRGDAYPKFRELDADDRLLPNRDDLIALAQFQSESLAAALFRQVPEICSACAASPGEIQEAVLGGRISVRAVLEDDDPPLLTVAISQRLRPGALELPPDWLFGVAATFLPDTPIETLSFAADLAGEPLRPDEVAFSDFPPGVL